MTTEALKPICCELLGKSKEYYVVRATVTTPLRPEIGVFKRKKNVIVKLPVDKVNR
jgi:hypothetical protein